MLLVGVMGFILLDYTVLIYLWGWWRQPLHNNGPCFRIVAIVGLKGERKGNKKEKKSDKSKRKHAKHGRRHAVQHSVTLERKDRGTTYLQ